MEELQELINKIRELKVRLSKEYPDNIRNLIIAEFEDAIRELEDILEILNNYALAYETNTKKTTRNKKRGNKK